jgi:hypothetical protein
MKFKLSLYYIHCIEGKLNSRLIQQLKHFTFASLISWLVGEMTPIFADFHGATAFMSFFSVKCHEGRKFNVCVHCHGLHLFENKTILVSLDY